MLLVLASAVGVGCATGAPKKACLEVVADPLLNLYEDQPHVVNLYLFPLSSTAGFDRASVRDLLEGAMPSGTTGSPARVTIAPGDERELEERFEGSTVHLGLLADYYRGPGDPEGKRKLVVPARCGFRTPQVQLTARDLFLD